MERIVLRANAKLNLSLDIVGRREDGYHLMDMVMQSISLCDRVAIVRTASLTPADFPYGERDIAYRAARVFFAETGLSGGAAAIIEKRIPTQAGMAGGSADAAAVLTGLDRLYKTGLSHGALAAIGVKAGADVPFCLTGGTARVGGIGEKVEPLPFFGKGAYLVVKPPFGVSTPAAFSAFDRMESCPRPDNERLIAEMGRFNLCGMAKAGGNVLEAAAALEAVGRIKAALIQAGAGFAQMTGSGSAVFGLFEEESAAERAQEAFSVYGETFLCTAEERGIRSE